MAKTTYLPWVKPLLLAAGLGLAAPLTALAQSQGGLFSPVVTVNDQAITQYEINQRQILLTLLRAPGDPAEEAKKGLIEDRLRLSATGAAGIILSPEQVREGMEEFAARANLTADQFIQAVGQAGVAEETFRDFVTAGLSWRLLVQQRFGPRAQVSDAEVDSALSTNTGPTTSVRVLLSEIVVPAQGPRAEQNRALIERLSNTLRGEAPFAAAARRFSASPTRGRGGRLDWLPIGNVPPALRAAVLVLEPGEVTDPIPLGPGIGIFQLRALEETQGDAAETLALEYATILIPGENAGAIAQGYRDRYDTCDDLYKPAQSLPPEYFDRVTLPAAEVPGDIALELAKLDANEVSTALSRQNGTFKLFVMLCGRTVGQAGDDAPQTETIVNEDGEEEIVEIPEVDERDQVRQQLFQQRLASYADSFLEELRADAIITEAQ